MEYVFRFLSYDRLTQYYDHLSTPSTYSTGSTVMDFPAQSASSSSPTKSLIFSRPATLSMPSLQVPVSSLHFLVLSLEFSVLRTGRYGRRLP
jgi:hypothetical protein